MARHQSKHRAGGASEDGRGPIRRRSWRSWFGAAVVGLLVATLAQVLLHSLFTELDLLREDMVSGILHAVIIAIPVILFLAWRTEVHAEQTLAERLRASESLRDDLVNMLVHDLKNPVISAAMAIRALARDRRESNSDADRENEMIDIAIDSLTRTEAMIGDILTAARAESGRLDPDFAEADLVGIIRRQVDLTMPRFEEKELELFPRFSDASIAVSVDVRMMRRVVDNLLENAVKHTPRGGRVVVAVQRGDKEVVVSVSDTGHGIPENLREKIFEKFGQAAARESGELSVGLGLVVCKRIVEAHGGRIWIERADEGGSDFRFAIPTKAAHPRGHSELVGRRGGHPSDQFLT